MNEAVAAGGPEEALLEAGLPRRWWYHTQST